MSPVRRSILFVSIILAAALQALPAAERTAVTERLEFHGQPYSVIAACSPGRADVILKGATRLNLSAGMGGENIPLATRKGSDNFYVFWLNHRDAAIRLAYYDFRRERSQLLDLPGFSFIAAPEVVEGDDGRSGLLFLGNRSDNDDIFYYDTANQLLTPLTATPFSEKGFSCAQMHGRLEITTRSLWAEYRYAFDPLKRECTLKEKTDFPARRRKVPADAAYCNTYVGFGDSITWGESEGEQRPDLGYLTQMQGLLADPAYAHYYGPAFPVNLGVPGETTADGVIRVDRELSGNPGLYFLLMMGVNDVIRSNCSVSSSLENLGYLVDAAAADGRRVIISTLTPSKSFFSLYAYYWQNLYDLSAGILTLAAEKKIASVDTLAAFMNTHPPDGWRGLLENIIPGVSSGNHPNAAGYRLIADLFAGALAAFPPLMPTGVRVLNPGNPLNRDVQWDANVESDFSHFAIEFAFSADTLSHRITTQDNHFSFGLFPFLPRLYFRLQSVDTGGHASGFTAVTSAQPGKNGGK